MMKKFLFLFAAAALMVACGNKQQAEGAAAEENQKSLEEWFGKAAGEELDVTFKGRVPKADLDKLNAKECTNTLVF